MRECTELYREWLEAGRPPVAGFARMHGLSRSAMDLRLSNGERPLDWEDRRLGLTRDPKRGYPTAREIYARLDAEEGNAT